MVSTEGDAFFIAFASRDDALFACADAQRALLSEEWPDDGGLRVRMGVHCGLAYPRNGDYVAYAVHQAARVVGAAHGGQVVVSADVARGSEHLQVGALRSLGNFRVRDFDDPVELFQLVATDLPDDFPPPPVLPADKHNVVRPLTALIGRGPDIDQLTDLLTTTRLVTIVGPGGLGKTRLAVEWALGHADDVVDGVWFVDLAPLEDDRSLPEAFGKAIGAAVQRGLDYWEAVQTHLANRSVVLVCDNCERLTSAVGLRVSDLLQHCPGVRVIATSREPLGIALETVWRLPPLSADEGAALFAARRGAAASAVDPSAVVDLCRELDGLPLAIELAAARSGVVTVDELLRRIEHQSQLLATNDPTLPERQRSLGALIGWSYETLGPAAQAALRRLSALAAGFDADTAAVAIGATDESAADATEVVWSLATKSLLVADPGAGHDRYRVLSTIRRFARSNSTDAELLDARSRVAHRFLGIFGPEVDKRDISVLSERRLELDNLRGLVIGLQSDDPQTAQLLALTIVEATHERSVVEALALCRSYLADLPTVGVARTALLLRQAALAIDCGDFDLASAALAQAESDSVPELQPDWLEGRLAYRARAPRVCSQRAGACMSYRRGRIATRADRACRGPARDASRGRWQRGR